MRNWLFLLVLAAAVAQSPPPQPPADRGLVLRFNVDLVQVDVVVTDSEDRRVPDLKAEDFEVRQDGNAQKITHFSYSASSISAQDGSTSPAQPGRGLLTRSEVRRTFVLMLDDAAIDFGDFRHTQEALLRFVDEDMQNGDIAAVVRTSGGAGAAQVFNFDRSALRRTIDRMVWRPPFSENQLIPPLRSALTAAIRAMADFPGRKSIILISPGIAPRLGAFSSPPSSWFEEREIADLANRSSVTIETIDVRGLPTLMESAATASGSPVSIRGLSSDRSIFNPNYSTQSMARYIASQDVLNFLAVMTAGRFSHNNNDIYAQVKAAADDAEGYYLLGWYPGADAFTQKPHQMVDYHHIQVRVRSRKGLTVRTRDGFFAQPDSQSLARKSPAEQMGDALFSPFRTGDIDVRLTASLVYDAASGAYIDSLLHILPHGLTFRDVADRADCKALDLDVLTTAMQLDPSGQSQGTFEGQRPAIQLCGKILQSVLAEGFVVTVRDRILVPGAYQMRVAVRNLLPGDRLAGKRPEKLVPRGPAPEHIPIGSANQVIEVPDLKKVEFTLSGITLWGAGGSGKRPPPGTNYRRLIPGDPAVRQFRAGETVNYALGVQRDPKKPAEGVEIQVKVVHEGKDIFASDPRTLQTGETLEGWYKLDGTLEPGQYLLGVQAKNPSAKAAPIGQWIDFEIVK